MVGNMEEWEIPDYPSEQELNGPSHIGLNNMLTRRVEKEISITGIMSLLDLR